MATRRQLQKAIRRLTPYTPAHRGIALDRLLEQLRELERRSSLDFPDPDL